MSLITGKTVLVSGTSRGLGLEFVNQLLAKNNRVIATTRSKDTPSTLTSLKSKYGEQLTHLSMDVADQASIDKCADEVK